MPRPVARDYFDPTPVVGVDCSKGIGARQEFKAECDINRIMARYRKTGQLPQGVKMGSYGDFSQVEDFQAAQNTLLVAQQQFDVLPSNVRKRFDNNPAKMLAFVADKKNAEEARKLGLLKSEPVVPPPMKVEVINAVPPGDKKP